MLQPEAWLRGPLPGVHPLLAPVIRSFEMAREDVSLWTRDLATPQIWLRPGGVAPIGFHLRHIPGSIDRLLTYAEGRPLDAKQMEFLAAEIEPGAGKEALMQAFLDGLREAEERVRLFDPATLDQTRGVGRRQLPTTVAGLLIHVAEHTQRHVGQLITTVRLVIAT
jgi:hypothetical protein